MSQIQHGITMSGGPPFMQYLASGLLDSGLLFAHQGIAYECANCGGKWCHVVDVWFYNGKPLCRRCQPPKPDGVPYIREDWIRESCPLDRGTPRAILADWCEDHGRDQDAVYLRKIDEGLK